MDLQADHPSVVVLLPALKQARNYGGGALAAALGAAAAAAIGAPDLRISALLNALLGRRSRCVPTKTEGQRRVGHHCWGSSAVAAAAAGKEQG